MRITDNLSPELIHQLRSFIIRWFQGHHNTNISCSNAGPPETLYHSGSANLAEYGGHVVNNQATFCPGLAISSRRGLPSDGRAPGQPVRVGRSRAYRIWLDQLAQQLEVILRNEA